MTSLKNKLIKNFIAGILACILIYSILITLFVTIRYIDLFKIVDENKTTLVTEWFSRLNKDDNISSDAMWSSLSDLSKQENVNIKYLDDDGYPLVYIKNIENQNNEEIKNKRYFFFEPGKKIESGSIVVEYTADYTTINRLQKDFKHAVIYAIISSLIIGSVIAVILSMNISEPIIKTNDFTVKIKEGIYGKMDTGTSDIKEIKNLQENINFLSKSLNMQENIRKQYAQDISHELRTPLTNLKLSIEALGDGMLPLNEDTINSLNLEINRLQSLIDNLKNSFNESVSMDKLFIEKVNVSSLLLDICHGFTGNFLNRNISLGKDIKKDVYMKTDRTKLSQIIQNLLTNAIKAIDRNGHIDIILRENNKNITIKIKDNGIGIDEDKLNMIFERFYRIDDSRNTKTNGIGLGLSISKNYIEALNGKIDVESEKGVGTCFTITFDK